MKSQIQRINNIIGQLEGVKKMVDCADCVKLLTQIKAARSALDSLMNNIIEQQFDNCIQTLKDEDKKLLIKIKNYVKSN